MAIETVTLFGIGLHRLRMQEAIGLVMGWMTETGRCRYVVTPHVDHIVMLQSDASMRAAYQSASLVVADGWPLVAVSRWLGRALPERVAGSDLVPSLLAAGGRIPSFRVFLLGGRAGTGQRAAEHIRQRWPSVAVCGIASPKFGFESDPKTT